MPIAKKRTIQDESLFLQDVCFWSICVKNDWFYDSAYMDEDQNSDLSDGQLDHSVGISQSIVVVVVEEEQSLEHLEVNCHEEQMNCHEWIQHSETEWAWHSLEYERTSACHIQDQFCACCGQAVPKV